MLTGCIGNTEQSYRQSDSLAGSTAITTAGSAAGRLPEKIIGERLQGTITLLDTINGKPVAEIYNNTLLNAAKPVAGWVMVGIETALTPVQDKSMQLKKGDTVILDGKPNGKALKDIHLETIIYNKQAARIGIFYGYVRESNINAASVIETALSSYLQEHNNRMLPDLQPFIRQFQLLTTGFNEPFLEYANYESSIDDPSPAYRTVLLFYKNKLIGVADSRGLDIQGTTKVKLDRDFSCYFFDDTDVKLQQEYVKMFNAFINSVD